MAEHTTRAKRLMTARNLHAIEAVVMLVACLIALAGILAGCPGDALEDCVERCVREGRVTTSERLPPEVHALPDRDFCRAACESGTVE